MTNSETFTQDSLKNSKAFLAGHGKPRNDSDDSIRKWVVLLEDRRQLGPLATTAVRELIQTGTIKYSEHAWSQGQNEWMRIGDIQEFGSESPVNQEETEKLDVEVDLSQVVQQVRIPHDLGELLPDQRDLVRLRDYTLPPIQDRLGEIVKGLGIYERSGEPLDFIEDRRSLNQLRSTKRLHFKIRQSKIFRDSLLVGGLSLFVILGLFGIYKVTLSSPKFKSARVSVSAPPAVVPQAAAEVLMTPQLQEQVSTGDEKAKAAIDSIARQLIAKVAVLTEARIHLKDDQSAWDLFYQDWVKAVESIEFDGLSPLTHRFGTELFQLQSAHYKVLEYGVRLNQSEESDSTSITDDLTAIIQKIGLSPTVEPSKAE
jgi:hypothetical protein